MITHTIRRGFDIKLFGAPSGAVQTAPEPLLVAVQATDFPGTKAKVLVQQGDTVETGQELFFDKKNPHRRFVSPVTGTVSKIVLGERRALHRIEVTPAEQDRHHAGLPRLDTNALDNTSRETVVEALRGSGLWSLLRERPVGRFADLEQTPAAVFVNGMDSEPLACDPAVACDGRREDLQLGVELLRRLTNGKIYLTVRGGGGVPAAFTDLRNVEMHAFDGPHPAGLVGTHIRFVQPLKQGETIWYLKAQELAELGEWVRTGHFPTHRVIAVGGELAPQAGYYRVRKGAVIHTLTGGKPIEDPSCRILSGTVLSGDRVDPTEGFLGHWHHTVTMFPDGEGKRDLLGWILPWPSKISVARSTFAFLKPGVPKKIDARINGGPRANVNIRSMESVTPLDIYPTFLMRAIQANDIEEALNLGLLEVTEEDVALCTFADPCKRDVGAVVRKGLEIYEAEF